MELELMLSLVGDVTGERIAEILGEELTGSLIENSGEDLREEGEMLQLRMDQWKVAVNPQVQKAAEAAERSRVVPGVEIADDYEPSREEVAHHWGVSAEKVVWAELGEEDLQSSNHAYRRRSLRLRVKLWPRHLVPFNLPS
mgnify:CR=1 FL=1